MLNKAEKHLKLANAMASPAPRGRCEVTTLEPAQIAHTYVANAATLLTGPGVVWECKGL